MASLIVAAAALAACSVKRTAVDIVGDAISGGSGVYASDDDPDPVREAIPFGLKTYESLLAVSPENKNLLLAAASGFVGYAYLLEQEADQLEATDPAGARALRPAPASCSSAAATMRCAGSRSRIPASAPPSPPTRRRHWR